MGLREHCAYNQTRECFLALETAERDGRSANLADLAESPTFNTGDGLWINPFNEACATNTSHPLDFVYLDDQSQVAEIAESSMTFSRVHVKTRIASVLVLPRHTIESSQTKPGDRVIICSASEMTRLLEAMSNPARKERVVDIGQMRGVLHEHSAGEAHAAEVPPIAELRHYIQPPEHGERPASQAVKGNRLAKWWTRWWSPDPRKAQRLEVGNLVAYYWTGSTPAPQRIRDISSTGLYLETNERWFPDTLILMTLQRANADDAPPERSIRVYLRAIRVANDGVGLQFVLPDARDRSSQANTLVASVSRDELDAFLREMRAEIC